jgi:hypothetical protein
LSINSQGLGLSLKFFQLQNFSDRCFLGLHIDLFFCGGIPMPALLTVTLHFLCSAYMSAVEIFLAYFQKKKVGLSNHQSVCVCVCHQLITFEPIGGFW